MKGHELGYDTKDMGGKKTIDKLIFIKKLNISIEWKGWVGENIFINHIYDKWLISKIYRELLKLIHKEAKKQNKTLEWAFL